MSCPKCEPFEGKWMMEAGGLRRCDCEEGQRLSRGPVAHPPVITPEQATVFVEMLASIPYFPGDSGARIAIGDEIAAMCDGPKTALWLVTRMRRLYVRWPGPMEMRRVCASRNVPWDGVLDSGISEIYPDGIPIERKQEVLALPAPRVRLLSSGQKAEVIEDPARAKAITQAAAKMPTMPSGRRIGGEFEALMREAETAPQDREDYAPPKPRSVTPQIINAEDVRQAVEELRRKRSEGGDLC